MKRDNRGVYAVEFAIITPAFLAVIVGFTDLGYQMYVGVVLQGAVNEAARNSTLEDATKNIDKIDKRVKDQVGNISPKATFESSRKSYTSFGEVGKPEPFNDDNNNNKYDPKECFEDLNGNGKFDQDRGKSGLGGPDDIVKYTMTVTYPSIMPVNMLGWFGDRKTSATTVLRNQPYGAQSIPEVKCPKK